jgi:hypothetical protein
MYRPVPVATGHASFDLADRVADDRAIDEVAALSERRRALLASGWAVELVFRAGI